jgi:hypothetical protein
MRALLCLWIEFDFPYLTIRELEVQTQHSFEVLRMTYQADV